MAVEAEISKIKETIGSLVYDKTALRKAYNYYHCVRDADQFKHLTENYGIGTPTAITFTPLIKKHIDVLVGEYLGLNQELKITCKDESTLSNILQSKHQKINLEVVEYLKKYLNNNIFAKLLDNKESVYDPFIDQEIKKIQSDIDQNYISDYEIAAQNILEYFRQSRNLDLKNKMSELFRDLLITGTCYYRVKSNSSKKGVEFEILNPLNTFIERNPNSRYLNASRRAVIRKWMTKEDILNTYRAEIDGKAAKEINDMVSMSDRDTPVYMVRYTNAATVDGNYRPNLHTGVLAGLEAHPGFPGDLNSVDNIKNNLIPVHEVEWLEVDVKTGNMTRHEGVQIGASVYITRGAVEEVVRSIEDPSKCYLSINGLFFLDRNGDPYSLMTNTMDLQDKYDLTIFYRDNLLGSSGTVGDWIDVSFIPSFLGDSMPERVQKWLAYKRSGLGLINSQEEGGERMTNTTFNGFDDTLKVQAIQGIQTVIQAIEQQAAGITGVLPERLAQYEQRDAVSNVQLGVKMSGLLTKQYFETMDTLYKEINYDLLNIAKIVYKSGLKGVLILGEKYSKLFTSLPEHYTVTDFDIHIEDSSKSFVSMETIKNLNTELIKAGASDPELAINIATANNLTQLKRYVSTAMKLKKEENNMVEQLQQQVQQGEESIKEMEKTNNQLQEEINRLTQQANAVAQSKIEIERERVELERQKLDEVKRNNIDLTDIKKDQLRVQIEQLYDNNPYNDKIRQM